jgi:hypothetical protein
MNLEKWIEEQAKFSVKTFGPDLRTKGIVDHITKELKEVTESSDLDEWCDIIILAFDGAWRSGYSPKEIADYLHKKLEINKKRKWPDWRECTEDVAIEHIREKP